MTLPTACPKPAPREKKARTSPRKHNTKREAREFQRCFGSPERVAFVQALPSVVSGKGPCVCAHVRGGGASRRGDARWTVPLTDAEHQEMHRGQASFAMRYGLDLAALAEETERSWVAHTSTGDAWQRTP